MLIVPTKMFDWKSLNIFAKTASQKFQENLLFIFKKLGKNGHVIKTYELFKCHIRLSNPGS